MGRPSSSPGPTGKYSELAAFALDPMRATPTGGPPSTYSPSAPSMCLCSSCLACPRTRPVALEKAPSTVIDDLTRDPQIADYLRFLRTPRWQTGNLPCFLSRDVDTWTQDRLALTCALRARGLALPFETRGEQSLDTPELKRSLLPAALFPIFEGLFPDNLRDTALHIARYPYMFDCHPLDLNPGFKSALRRDLKRKLRINPHEVFTWNYAPSLYDFIPIKLRIQVLNCAISDADMLQLLNMLLVLVCRREWKREAQRLLQQSHDQLPTVPRTKTVMLHFAAALIVFWVFAAYLCFCEYRDAPFWSKDAW